MREYIKVANAWSIFKLRQAASLGQYAETDVLVLRTAIVDERWPRSLVRLSYVISIVRALCIALPNQQQADNSMRRPVGASVLEELPHLR